MIESLKDLTFTFQTTEVQDKTRNIKTQYNYWIETELKKKKKVQQGRAGEPNFQFQTMYRDPYS